MKKNQAKTTVVEELRAIWGGHTAQDHTAQDSGDSSINSSSGPGSRDSDPPSAFITHNG